MVRYKTKGFTLIEIMVLVAIIGILAAIMLPAIGDYKKREQLDEKAETYAEDFEELQDEYIRNDVRKAQQVEIKRHSDGTLWACNLLTDDCYKVVK